jgi:AraC family transcriptional regulator
MLHTDSQTPDLLPLVVNGASTHFHPWQAKKIAELLSKELSQEIPVQIAANRCRLSVSQFSRLFKAAYGMPFHQFRLRERILRAQARLASSSESISTIALDCGFADQSCFTRRFTTILGTPPGIWRRRAKAEAGQRPPQT